MKKKIVSIIITLALTVNVCMVAAAAENPAATRNGLQSEGAIHYADGEGGVILDAEDLYMLADQLDLFKVRVSKQLGIMQTYLTRSDTGIPLTSADNVYAVHKKPNAGEEIDPLTLDFASILEAVAVSQSIPQDAAAYGLPSGTKLYKTPEGRLVKEAVEGAEPINIQAASADNLSAGTAAWVNGRLLLGTGADTADSFDSASKKPGIGSSAIPKKVGVSKGYTLTEDLASAYAYVVSTCNDGNHAGADPVFEVKGGGHYEKIFSAKYTDRGYNVRTALYYISDAPQGSVVKGSNGILFY